MDKQDCINEKWSNRTIGFVILPFAIALSAIGFLILPVVGLFFAVPLFLFSFALITAPESKVCKFILGRDEGS